MTPAELVKRWRAGLKGFMAFVKDAQLQALEAGRWVPFTLWPWQIEALKQLFATKPFPRTVVLILPRRSGKTTLAAALTTWAAFTRTNATVGAGANSEDQAATVPYRMLRQMILRSPLLCELAGGAGNVREEKIVLPALGSEIRPLPNSPASVYGVGFTVAWVSELGEGSPDLFHVMSSGALDRPDGFVIVDSTPSGKDHLLAQLYHDAGNLGGPDPTTFCYYRTWHAGEPPLNPNLQPVDLESRRRQMLPAQFARLHCAEWVSGASLLFQPEQIAQCAIPEAPAVAWLRENYKDVRFAFGCDFAIAGSKHGDRSYIALTARATDKIDLVDESPSRGFFPGAVQIIRERIAPRQDYYLLRLREAPTHEDRIRELDEIFKLLRTRPDAGAVEIFQGSAFIEHCAHSGIRVEVIHPSLKTQAEAFTNLHEIVTQGRLKIPAAPEFDVLRAELGQFECDSTGITPSFGARGKGRGGRDDSVYATTWAVSSAKNLSSGWKTIKIG